MLGSLSLYELALIPESTRLGIMLLLSVICFVCGALSASDLKSMDRGAYCFWSLIIFGLLNFINIISIFLFQDVINLYSEYYLLVIGVVLAGYSVFNGRISVYRSVSACGDRRYFLLGTIPVLNLWLLFMKPKHFGHGISKLNPKMISGGNGVVLGLILAVALSLGGKVLQESTPEPSPEALMKNNYRLFEKVGVERTLALMKRDNNTVLSASKSVIVFKVPWPEGRAVPSETAEFIIAACNSGELSAFHDNGVTVSYGLITPSNELVSQVDISPEQCNYR